MKAVTQSVPQQTDLTIKCEQEGFYIFKRQLAAVLSEDR